jgi:hypothetical protein
VDKAPHNITYSQITKIIQVMKSLIRDAMAKACRRSRKRTKAKVETDGDFYYKIALTYCTSIDMS